MGGHPKLCSPASTPVPVTADMPPAPRPPSRSPRTLRRGVCGRGSISHSPDVPVCAINCREPRHDPECNPKTALLLECERCGDKGSSQRLGCGHEFIAFAHAQILPAGRRGRERRSPWRASGRPDSPTPPATVQSGVWTSPNRITERRPCSILGWLPCSGGTPFTPGEIKMRS